MGCHLDNMQSLLPRQVSATLLLLSLPMLLFDDNEMGGYLNRRGKLMCRFGMALVSISSGTWVQIKINSCSTTFTMDGSGLIVLFLLVYSSILPTLIVFKVLSFLTESLQTSGTLVSSPSLRALLYILPITIPRERGKPKRDPAYYNFIANALSLFF